MCFRAPLLPLLSVPLTGGSKGETEPHRAAAEGEGAGPTGGRQSGHDPPEGHQRGGY